MATLRNPLPHVILNLMTNAEFKKRALELPPEERVELIDTLIEEGLPPLTDEQKALLDRRWDAYKANSDDVFPADKVHAELIARQK